MSCVAVAAGLLLLTAPVAVGVPGDFSAPASSPEIAGDAPQAVASGDFNADGKRDLAVGNFSSDNVTILLGAGTGDFSAAATGPEATGGGPGAVAVGDFNGDGKQDLATANFFSNNVTVLLGDGTGNFNPAATSPEAAGAGSLPESVAVGDFNGDGKQDLAIANGGTDNVAILLGDGTGNFTAAATSPETAGSRPLSIAVGDFNGDGKQDLAVANASSSNVTILLGDGTGNFSAAATSPEAAGTGAGAVAVGDFNDDGKQDLATANQNSDNVTVLIGAGTGNFTATATGPEAAGDGPSSIAVDDFDGDGKQDLATANLNSDNVTVLIGQGSGDFSAAGTSPESAGDGAFSIAVDDFNGDGKRDLATANTNSDNVTILINQTPPRSNANFSAPPSSPEAAGDAPTSVAVGDFNGDGIQDLATANILSNNVTILLGTGTAGDFSPAATTPEAVGAGPRSVAAGDFNGDGKPDLATANADSDNVTVLLGDGTGNFNAAATSPETAGDRPESVAVGDFNGDGKQDLATANSFSDNVTVLLGDGTGNFSPAATSPEPAGDSPVSIAIGDFNGDGKPDLATANAASDDVTVLLGTGTAGDFSPAATDPETAGDAPRSVAVGDFNGDGKQDLATANTGSDNVTIVLGDGTGNFSAAGTSPEAAGDGPVSVAAGDFNGDGKQDLATANALSDNVTVLLGDGTGNFSAAATSPEAAGDGPVSVAIGDFNGDGKPDLATAILNADNVAILLGDDPTVAVDDAKAVAEDAAATTIDVRSNDTDNDSAKEKIASINAAGAAHGSVTITNGGDDLTYTPAAGYCNAGAPNDADPDATFTYTLTDGGTATVSVTVNCVDDPTAAVDDAKTVDEDATATTIDVRTNDTDTDSANEKIASVTAAAAAHGTVAITSGGDDLTYTPAADYCGDATFTYTLTGGSQAMVSLTVTCVDDAPRAVDDATTIDQDSGTGPIDVLGNDTDVDGGSKQVASVTQPGNGIAEVAAGGSRVTYAPAAGYCNSQPGGAPDRFTYKLESGSQATVAVTVNCAPRAAPGEPVAPRLAAGHRRVPLVRGRVVLRMTCRGTVGQSCAGTVTLKATSRESRLKAAAAGRARFSVAAGRSATVRVEPTEALRALLRKRGKAVAELTATMRGDGATRSPLKRLITVQVSD